VVSEVTVQEATSDAYFELTSASSPGNLVEAHRAVGMVTVR